MSKTLYSLVNEQVQQDAPNSTSSIMTYDEFKESRKDPKYKDGTFRCYACGAKEAYWEIGDSRYYCPGCEKCANLVDDYVAYRKMRAK